MLDTLQLELDNNKPSPVKQKKYNNKNKRAVKRLKVLLARTKAKVYALVY